MSVFSGFTFNLHLVKSANSIDIHIVGSLLFIKTMTEVLFLTIIRFDFARFALDFISIRVSHCQLTLCPVGFLTYMEQIPMC